MQVAVTLKHRLVLAEAARRCWKECCEQGEQALADELALLVRTLSRVQAKASVVHLPDREVIAAEAAVEWGLAQRGGLFGGLHGALQTIQAALDAAEVEDV